MKKKIIIFRVIGNQKYGLGHIYRSLTIAKKLDKFKIIFVSTIQNKEILEKLVSNIYDINIFSNETIIDNIIKLRPLLVINDILSTKVKDVVPLKKSKIKTLNFEDLGPGAKYANLVINEIHEKSLNKNENTLWGSNYFFLRDEFKNVKRRIFKKKIKNVLITFGGSDQHNLTLKSYLAIKNLCLEKSIKINIVTGPAYNALDELHKYTFDDSNVEIFHSTGIISKIMEKSDIAISSNGRTVFELAHMNIPSIIIPQHKREQSHSFATSESGFIILKVYKKGYLTDELKSKFEYITSNHVIRKSLMGRMSKYNFVINKDKIVKLIDSIINQ